MDKLFFESFNLSLSLPDGTLVAKATEQITKEKKRFFLTMALAVLNKPNGNGHRIMVDQAQKAIAALGEKLMLPVNLNHKTAAYGSTDNVWIDDPEKDFPLLMLSAVFWTRYIPDDAFNKILSSWDDKTMGASWEIDSPYKLVADKNDSRIQDVEDFNIAAAGVMTEDLPAERSTQGTAVLTASKANIAQSRRSDKYGIGIKGDMNIEKPDVYKDLPEAQFGDPVNYRYPLSATYLPVGVDHFNRDDREKCGYTTEEWSIIGSRVARAAGSVYENESVKIKSGCNIINQPYGDMGLDFIRDIPCPICHCAWGTIQKADFEKGTFVVECGGIPFDEVERHRFTVSIIVKPESVDAQYKVMPSFNANEGIVGVTLEPMEVTEKMEKLELTQEELDAKIAVAVKGERAATEKREAEMKTQQEEMDVKLEAARTEGYDKGKVDGINEYKTAQALAAKRVDEIHAIVPFETEETRLAALVEYANMSEEDFERVKSGKNKDKVIADMTAELAIAKGGNPPAALPKPGMPAGDDKITANKKVNTLSAGSMLAGS